MSALEKLRAHKIYRQHTETTQESKSEESYRMKEELLTWQGPKGQRDEMKTEKAGEGYLAFSGGVLWDKWTPKKETRGNNNTPPIPPTLWSPGVG